LTSVLSRVCSGGSIDSSDLDSARSKSARCVDRLRPAEFFPAHDVGDLPPKASVAQQRVHIVVAGEIPLVLFVPPEGGRMRMHRCVTGIGIAIEAGIAGIERQAAGGRVEFEIGRSHARLDNPQEQN
jgi:hypothetical protein